VKGPSRTEYDEIFRRTAERMEVSYHPEVIDFLFREYYGRLGFPPRACHPRDLLEHAVEAARFRNIPLVLGVELLKHSADSYFIDVATPDQT
jgi:hypothetical protein